MKKAIVFVVAFLAIIPMVSTVAEAKSGYLSSVNTTCTPDSYSCSLCHPNGNTGSLTNTGVAYSANYDECVICPDALACGGTGNPPPNCTDYDNDGDGWTTNPDCSPILDCNDTNIKIYPGAPEIACDGVDQDCSGADKTKGKGCRKR